MGKQKFYAIVEGYKPGIYDEWFGSDGAEAQIKGFPKAVYKSFALLEDAETWFTRIAGKPPELRPQLTLTQIAIVETQPTIKPDTALQEGKVVIFTDGSSNGNPGPGGYGVVLRYKEQRKELHGGFALTTNNRMELMAAIVALQSLKGKRSVVIYSDSAYMVNAIQKGWALKWRQNGWERKEKEELKAAKNADLWQKLLELCDQHQVEFVQVPGHGGVPENERCDRLAQDASKQMNLPADLGFA